MNVFVIGGTGFIGYHAVKEFLLQGHRVTVLALPPLPVESLLPPEVETIFANLNELSDNEVSVLLHHQDAVVGQYFFQKKATPAIAWKGGVRDATIDEHDRNIVPADN